MSKVLSPTRILVKSHSAASLSPLDEEQESTTPESHSLNDNHLKTPEAIDKPYNSLNNLDDKKETLGVPHIIINRVQGKRNHFLQSTAGETDRHEHDVISGNHSELKKEEEHESVSPNSEGKGLAIEPIKLDSIPKIEPFDEQFDEFSVLVSTSPKNQENEENFEDESPKMLKPKAFLVVQTKTLTPYLSNVKSSPFMKEQYSQDKPNRPASPICFKDHDASQEESQISVVEKVANNILGIRKLDKDVMMNSELLINVCGFLEYGDVASLMNVYPEYLQATQWIDFFKSQFLRLFLSEPYQEQQCLFWSGVMRNNHRLRGHFEWSKNSTKSCDSVDDICKDLDRTLPEYEIFQSEDGRNPLLRVLMALCNTYPEMGYVQGLNSLVGVTLFYLKEKEAYILMLYLLDQLQAKKIYYPDFEGLAVLNYQLEAYLEHYLPEIMKLFKDNSMTISYYTYTWFITLFADNLKMQNVVKLWNFFFLKGFPFLIQFSLALFSIHKDELLKMDIDEVGSFIKSRLWSLDTNEEEIFVQALKFKVTEKQLSDLENLYNTGKPQVRFIETDDESKSSWERIEKQPKRKQQIGSSSNDEHKEEKKNGQGLKPFLKNVINVTLDIPGAFGRFFKKSPVNSNNKSPQINLKTEEKSHDITEEVQPSKILQEIQTENTKVNDSTPSYKPRLFDLGKPIGVVGEASVGSILSEEEKEKENIVDNTNRSEQNSSILPLDLDLSKQEDIDKIKRRSIATRLRKNIDKNVPSKTFTELPDESEEIIERDTLKWRRSLSTSQNNETLMVIKWDEIDEMDGDKSLNEGYITLHRGTVNTEEGKDKPLYDVDEDIHHSDTDCTHLDDEIPISYGDETPTKYLGDCTVINHSKSWPEQHYKM